MEKENDMPRNWYNSKDSPLWHKRVYMLWYNMWHRVYHDEYYLGCLIQPSFKYLSNFLEWLEQEPNFEEFKNTCHEVRWSIDKDMKCSGNRNYYPEFRVLKHKGGLV